MHPAGIETPCIRICRMHPVLGFCEGCGRTLAEIGGWLAMTGDQRQAVMDGLAARLAGMAVRT